MRKLIKKAPVAKITSTWGLSKEESCANWIRAEKSVMSKFKRDQIVQVKNLDNGNKIYVPIRGAGMSHKKMFRTTIAMSYDNAVRLETKGSKNLNLQVRRASVWGVLRHNLNSKNSEHAAAYQISLVSLIVSFVLGLAALI